MNYPPAPADRVASILQNLGEAYLARGQYAEAAAKFAQLLQAGNAAPELHRHFALALLGLNRADAQAQLSYQHVLQLFPNDRELLLKICRALLAHHAREAFARRLYKQVLTLSPPASSDILHSLAQHFLKNEQFHPAFETLKRAALAENGESAHTLTQLLSLGQRLEKQAEVRSVLEYLAGRNEKAAVVRRMLALDSAYAIHRAAQQPAATASPAESPAETGQNVATRSWRTIVQSLSSYEPVEYVAALRELSVLRLALALAQQAQTTLSSTGTENMPAGDISFTHELTHRFLPRGVQDLVPPPQASHQILALKIANYEQLAAGAGAAVAHALADKFIEFSIKYLTKAAQASCYRMRDGLLAFADSLKLLTLAAVDLLHKIERYNVTAKPATQIWVHTVTHAQSEKHGEHELQGWCMLYEALHMLEMKAAVANSGVQEQRRNCLRVACTVHQHRIGAELLPAKHAGELQGDPPFFRTEMCEAIWRNPLEYVQEQTPYLLGKFWVTAKLRGSRNAGTYLARDRELERAVVLKALSPHTSYQLMQEPALREHVIAAIRKIGRLALPGVAMIYDMGFQEEIFFFVREYLEGKALDQILHSRRHLSLAEGLALGLRLCRILQAAQREGLRHGNLQPGNLWLLSNGAVKISDFYVPLFVDHPDPNNLLHPASWQYCAPERRNGTMPNTAGDVFSLGAILHEALTGELPPAVEENTAVVVHKEAAQGSMKPALPPIIGEITWRACSENPAERFQSFAEFEQVLRHALALLQKDQEVSFDEIARLGHERRLLDIGRRDK